MKENYTALEIWIEEERNSGFYGFPLIVYCIVLTSATFSFLKEVGLECIIIQYHFKISIYFFH